MPHLLLSSHLLYLMNNARHFESMLFMIRNDAISHHIHCHLTLHLVLPCTVLSSVQEKALKETREEIAELEKQKAMLILKLEGLIDGSQEFLLSPRDTTRSRLVSQISSEYSKTGLTSPNRWGLLRESVRGGKYDKPQREGSLPRTLKGVLKKTEG